MDYEMDDEKKLEVLIVDDDLTTRKIHGALIRRLGATAFTAENGEQAVNLHHAGASFDLVLMDKDMPIMDGPMATKKLRGMGVSSMIVGVTSRADEDDEKEAFMKAGLDHCFGKPLGFDRIAFLFDQLKTH